MTRDLNRIIYVDDEPHIRAVAQIALEKVGGFTVMVCDSGQCLLDGGAAFQPDLILLDVMMPGLDGPSTLAAMRKDAALKDVPAMFVTAKTQAVEIARFKQLGALDVIPKPFRPLELSNQIRERWQSESKN